MNINSEFPNPWDLRYFKEVAGTLNFSRAAERLGVGQPALSLAMKRLEEQLNAALFLRRSRGLVLTPAGEHLLRQCDQLLGVWGEIVSGVQSSKTELKARYRLGCHPSVALYALNPFLRRFFESFPEIDFELVHGLSRVVCENVISGRIDFGFVVNPVAHPDLVIRRLAVDDVTFWSTKDSLEGVLIFNPELVQSQALLKKAKLQFKKTVASESLEVIAALARSGAGAAILPGRVVRALAPELHRLKELPVFRDEITFVYRKDIPKTAASRAVIEAAAKIEL